MCFVSTAKEGIVQVFEYLFLDLWPASWSSGQSLWLLIMRSRVRFPALPWVFSLKGKIPGSTVGIFLEGKDSHGDHGLGRLVECRFKAPPGTTSFSITTHTPSGQRNCASWASQPRKSVTLLLCARGRTTKSTKRHVVALRGKKKIRSFDQYFLSNLSRENGLQDVSFLLRTTD